MCAQIATFNLIGQSKTRNLFFTMELSYDSNRHVYLSAVDQPLGTNYECEATAFSSDGNLVYYLLNDSESHQTHFMTYDISTDEMSESDTQALPYQTSHDSHTYRGRYAKIFDQNHFALVYIDSALYGLPGPSGYELGSVVDSRTAKRRY